MISPVATTCAGASEKGLGAAVCSAAMAARPWMRHESAKSSALARRAVRARGVSKGPPNRNIVDATFTAVGLTSAERRRLLARRPWRTDERRVVLRGVAGRAVTALEPAAIGGLLLWVAVVLAMRVSFDQGRLIHAEMPVAVIFAPVALAFFVY